MASVALASGGRFEIGRVIERTFGVLRRDPLPYLLLGFVLYALPKLLFFLIFTARTVSMSAQSLASFNPVAFWSHLGVVAIIFSVVTWVIGLALQPALFSGMVVGLSGGTPQVSKMLAVGVRLALPVFAIAVITTICFTIGMVLLIVPGIIVGLMLCVAAPVRVAEGPGIIRALQRSAELTQGYRWALLGLFAIFIAIFIGISLFAGVITIGLTAVTGGLAAMATAGGVGPLQTAMLVVNVIFGTLESLMIMAAIASAYVELRGLKDGVGPETLAAAFD